MSLWRLEWLRMFRTPRALALAAVFLATGLIEPVTTRYASAIVARVGGGAPVPLPRPTPAAALGSYVSQATLIGLIVLVAVAAGTYGFDSRPGVAAFFRTRAPGMWALVAPRFTACAAAGAAGYLLGTLAAWYETRLLIGSLPAGGVAAGLACGAVYLVFAVAVAALAASLTRSAVAAVGITLGILLAIPALGAVHVLSEWVPSALAGAPPDLAVSRPAHDLGYYLPSMAVAAAAGALALAAAVTLLSKREI